MVPVTRHLNFSSEITTSRLENQAQVVRRRKIKKKKKIQPSTKADTVATRGNSQSHLTCFCMTSDGVALTKKRRDMRDGVQECLRVDRLVRGQFTELIFH